MTGGSGAIHGVAGTTTSRPATREEVRRAAQGLEAVLLRQLISSMEKAQLEHGFFGRTAGAGARQTTFELLLSQALAEDEPLGLAEEIAEQLTPGEDDAGRLRAAATAAGEVPLAGVLDRGPLFSGNFHIGTQGGAIPAEEKGRERLPAGRSRED